MAKAIRAYEGYNSFFNKTEVAQRDDGVWFHRSFANNGYAKAWTKWEKVNSEIVHPQTLNDIQVYSDVNSKTELSEEVKQSMIIWDKNKLNLIKRPLKYRLP